MAAWTSDELSRIAKAEELQIAGRKDDDTLRKPVIIWVVRLGDDLYVRSVNGRTSGWFRGVQAQHQGRIWAGGIEKDVTVEEETNAKLNDRIDAEYRNKYRRYAKSIVDSIVSDKARAATIKLVPRAQA